MRTYFRFAYKVARRAKAGHLQDFPSSGCVSFVVGDLFWFFSFLASARENKMFWTILLAISLQHPTDLHMPPGHQHLWCGSSFDWDRSTVEKSLLFSLHSEAISCGTEVFHSPKSNYNAIWGCIFEIEALIGCNQQTAMQRRNHPFNNSSRSWCTNRQELFHQWLDCKKWWWLHAWCNCVKSYKHWCHSSKCPNINSHWLQLQQKNICEQCVFCGGGLRVGHGVIFYT